MEKPRGILRLCKLRLYLLQSWLDHDLVHRSMINSVALMLQGTLALIFACILGVSGLVENVQFHGGTLVVVPDTGGRWGLALGGIAFVSGANKALISHEQGHLKQEQLLGALYLPIVGVPSVVNYLFWTYGWPESWADELGHE